MRKRTPAGGKKPPPQKLSHKKRLGKNPLAWPKSLSAKLYGSLILFFSFTLIVSLFSWNTLLKVADTQKILAEQNIPELVLASSIVQQSERLIKSAPQLIAGFSKESLNQIKGEIKRDSVILKKYLDEFEKSSLSKNSRQIRGLINEMTDNLAAIERSVERQRELLGEISGRHAQLHSLSLRLYKILVIEIDNKTFDLAVQSKAISLRGAPPPQPIQPADILFYKELMNLQSQLNISAHLLEETAGLSHSDFIQPLRERFLSAIQSCEKSAKRFPSGHDEIKAGIQSFKRLGLGDGKRPGIFDLKTKILKIEKIQNQYLEKNRKIAHSLSETAQNISLTVKTGGQASVELFQKSLRRNKTALFIINGLSLAGCLMAGVFLAAPLVRRLMYLAKTMKAMSKGRLDREVKVEGSDEVAEMAEALEVFRLYALEVQRLNLVEKLMKEVQEKNQKLEETVNHLHRTQKQLVLREKLASLGQLTAGIAHEIKNPLNFINNFSQLSEDLFQDLHQEIQKAKADIEPDAYAFIQETLGDLRSNMKKIGQHGDRAGDIITGMLQHSRAPAGKKNLVNLNRYMDIYSNLAFHSKRAVNPSFNVSFEKDYDKSLSSIEAVPQDISRVILNITANACDAVEETQSKREGIGCIRLKTKKARDKAEIKVWDNGGGIAKSLREKIFNPFFTTKDTGKGTGLGLSLSHDIVRKYGGVLSVDSKEGEWTEFTVTLPLKAPSA